MSLALPYTSFYLLDTTKHCYHMHKIPSNDKHAHCTTLHNHQLMLCLFEVHKGLNYKSFFLYLLDLSQITENKVIKSVLELYN